MRVLVVSDLYPPAAVGGYELSCADVVGRWREAGHTVTVLSTGALDLHEDAVVRELPFVAEGTEVPAEMARAVTATVRSAADDADVVTLWNLARVPQRPLMDGLVAAGRPAVIVACDGWLSRSPVDQPPLPTGSRVVWVSHALQRTTAVRPWVPADATVIGSGIDERLFPATVQPERPWQGRLLYVGRLSPAKGVQDAITALAALPGAHLDVVGRGTPQQRRDLAALAAEIGVEARVHFGEAARTDLPRIYRSADAVLFPSRWAEPFGLVPLEAMACSTPVIATGTGGSGEYLRDGGNALVVRPGDPAALAAAVRRLAADPALRAELVRQGRPTAAAHSIERTAAALATELRRAAEAANASS
jgi:glycosyltransferase involved in cell wall biosynthesis